jgi:predicted DNA-binding protein
MNDDSRVLSLRLSEELAAEIAAIARVDGMTLSKSIRQAIEKHIEARQGDPEFKKRLRKRLEEDREALERLLE